MFANSVQHIPPRGIRHLIRNGVLAAAAAAVAVLAGAAVARAAGTHFEVDGKTIPLSAFPFWTIVAAVAGILTATLVRNRHRFIQIGIAATALSLIPPLLMADAATSRLVLVALHLAAAVIVIPAIARTLTPRHAPEQSSQSSGHDAALPAEVTSAVKSPTL